MGVYRMSIGARLFFDVKATHADGACEEGRRLATEWAEGLNVAWAAGSDDVRVYPDETDEATMEDGPEDEDPDAPPETEGGAS